MTQAQMKRAIIRSPSPAFTASRNRSCIRKPEPDLANGASIGKMCKMRAVFDVMIPDAITAGPFLPLKLLT